MKYINDGDLEFIMGKYHDPGKPFDPLHRFVCREDIFDKSTGLSPAIIKERILENDAANAGRSRILRKTDASVFVLDNTRILVSEHDYFPAVQCIDRTVGKTLVKMWQKETESLFFPETAEEIALLDRTGAASVYPDYDHSVPVWDRILGLGFEGIRAEAEGLRRRLSGTAGITEKQDAFFEAVDREYSAVLRLIRRLSALAESEEKRNAPSSEKTDGTTPDSKLHELGKELLTVSAGPPKTFYGALLVIYIYFVVCEHIDGLQTRSLSGLDRTLLPFYRCDLARGVPEEKLRTYLAYFFMQFTAIGNYWNQPLYLGGTGDDGQCLVNPLSHMILDVYDSMNIYNPKLQFKVSENTPDDFLKKALDMIRRGHNSVVFVNEELTVRALEAAGISPEDARHADIKGCYEYAAPGELITEMFYVNSLKPLEYVLHNGRDGITGEEMGLKTGEPECFGDFGEFFDAYLAQLGALLDRVCEIGNVIESHYTDINPQPLYSATVRECLEKGREAYDGGAKYNNSSLEFGFIATAADSLNAIRKYVYEKKTVTLRQLKDILDADWTGFEPLRRRIMNDPEKYGNNREEPDRIAVRITEFLYGRVVGRPNSPVRGGSWNAGLHVARQYIYQGKKTAATPDGRKAREELSKNASPSQGCGREGATAAILSVTKINAVHLREDVSLDLALLPASVSGNDGLTAMLGLVRTFMRLGGHAVHMNVFDTVMLNDAFQNPDKYRDLQIRVCGWNVLWNNLGSAEQLAYIRQAEALK